MVFHRVGHSGWTNLSAIFHSAPASEAGSEEASAASTLGGVTTANIASKPSFANFFAAARMQYDWGVVVLFFWAINAYFSMDAAQLAQFVADADISLVTQSKMAEIIDDIRGGVLGGETLDAVFALFKGQLQLTESDRRAIGEFLAVAAKSLMEAGVDSDAIGWVLEMARNEIGDVPFHATGGSVAFFAGGGVYGSEINGLSRAGYIALFALVAASAKESVLLTFSGDLGRPESISLWIGAGTATFRAVDVPPEDGGGSLAARRVQSWSSIGSDGVSVGESDGGKILEIAR